MSMPQKPPLQVARHLETLPPYAPIEPFEVLSARYGRRPDQIIKLDANENPYGPSPLVRSELGRLEFTHIYPDPESRALRRALSTFTGVPQENLLAGSGADELIDLLMRVFLEPGDCVLNCPPTFGMYAFDARVNAGNLVEVPRRADFSLDLQAIRAALQDHHPKLLFLASPNNPNGLLLQPDELKQLLELPVVLVLDEAYIEFSGEGSLGEMATRITQVPRRTNLVVLRTFSKWAGLAGLRVGYGAFPGWLMPVLWKTKQPYNVNVAASTAAILSIQDASTLAMVVDQLRSERERLFSALQAIPFLEPYPSQANFVLCRVLERDASDLKNYLASQHGILVRYFNSPGLKDHIRISVGRQFETDRLLQALKSW